MVELALTLPLLFLLTFSIVDFASLFYVYLALENGVSQAGRFGVTGNVAAREDPRGIDPGGHAQRHADADHRRRCLHLLAPRAGYR